MIKSFVTEKNKYKVSLEYHIKNCYGPCQHFETAEEYKLKIDQIRNMLKGHLRKVREFLIQRMNKYAENTEFEKAQELSLVIEKYPLAHTLQSCMDDAKQYELQEMRRQKWLSRIDVR